MRPPAVRVSSSGVGGHDHEVVEAIEPQRVCTLEQRL
jgi:hypothetical protein